MNMNKILATGLIAAVASTAAFAQCGNGGFYVGVNAGAGWTKAKWAQEGENGSKKKTKFLAELVLGYDHRINDVMIGIDLTAGAMFGKTKAEDYTLKNNWSFALMPRVGYLVTPQLEIYATGGLKTTQFKFTEDNNTAKKWKFFPVIGGGLRYEITPDIYAKLEYNFDFKKAIKLPEGSQFTSVKPQAHIVKLGVGFRF